MPTIDEIAVILPGGGSQISGLRDIIVYRNDHVKDYGLYFFDELLFESGNEPMSRDDMMVPTNPKLTQCRFNTLNLFTVSITDLGGSEDQTPSKDANLFKRTLESFERVMRGTTWKFPKEFIRAESIRLEVPRRSICVESIRPIRDEYVQAKIGKVVRTILGVVRMKLEFLEDHFKLR
ncbi:hypothetical protein GIB67_008371 [Kingdonia uniflora]|uniref:Uncharacterized protein n=1 Tax=Kingdonia uniflora TaxID=39325 RepID=A0A7J7N5C4_9MAGN|nr:hypothetical protein GIB67_008371 [Kingdonia uniflora]